MFCTNCGKETEGNVNFCPECGALVRKTAESTDGRSGEKGLSPEPRICSAGDLELLRQMTEKARKTSIAAQRTPYERCWHYGLKVSSVLTGISRTSARSIRVSRDMEVGMLGASILLMCVRLMPANSASWSWVKPFNLR